MQKIPMLWWETGCGSKIRLSILVWEALNNPQFKGVEFDPLLREAGSNAFTLSPSRWIELTGAINPQAPTA